MVKSNKKVIVIFFFILLILFTGISGVYIYTNFFSSNNTTLPNIVGNTKNELSPRLSDTQFPLVEDDTGLVTFDCTIVEVITKSVALPQNYEAPLSIRCQYLDKLRKTNEIIVPIAIKGPDGDANINGYYFESFDWEEMDAERLIDSIRLSYWRTHQEQYDDPGTWINGGNGDGVDINEGDIISVNLASNYQSQIYTNPGYSQKANFGKEARHSLYSEESYVKFLETGRTTDLETNSSIEINNFLWPDNIVKDIFKLDVN